MVDISKDRLLWKIYFWDRRKGVVTRTNLEIDSLEDLPILPVILIINIREDQHGLRACMEFGRNYYCLVGNEWWSSSLSGLHNYVDFYRGDAAVLRGGMVENDLFAETMQASKEDKEILSAIYEWFERDPIQGID